PRPPRARLFPYTTLFRSQDRVARDAERIAVPDADEAQERGHVALQRIGTEREIGGVRAGQQLLEARHADADRDRQPDRGPEREADRKSTRLNSSHQIISY